MPTSSAGSRARWDDEARRQLATDLPRLVRRSGLGAEQRTQSILEKKGVPGVLEEIDKLEGDYARRLYFQALVKQAPLDAVSVLPVLSKITERMSTSDYDRRETLTTIAGRVKLNERAAAAYVAAIGPMTSDYDRRQALSALFAMQPLPAGVANLALKSTAAMHSDYDRREVIRAALVHGASVDKADALFPSIAQIQSSYDKREVLLELIKANAVGADARNDLLTVAAGVSSDYDRRVVLDAFVKAYGVDSRERRAVLRRGESHEIGLRPRRGAGRAAQSQTARRVNASGVRGRSRWPQVDVRPESGSGRIGEVGALNQTISTRISASAAWTICGGTPVSRCAAL